MTGTSVRYEEQRLIAADPEAIFEILRTPAELVMLDPKGCLMKVIGGPVDSVDAVDDRFICRYDPQVFDMLSLVVDSVMKHTIKPDETAEAYANMTRKQKREFSRMITEEITDDVPNFDFDLDVSVFDVEMVVSRYERNRSIAWKMTPLEETDRFYVAAVRMEEENGYDLEAVDGGTLVTTWLVHWSEEADDDDDDQDALDEAEMIGEVAIALQQRAGLAMLARTVAQRTRHTG